MFSPTFAWSILFHAFLCFVSQRRDEKFARLMTTQNQNWLTTYLRKSDRSQVCMFRERLKLFMTCSTRIYMQFIFDCSCIETDTGRPAYSEPLSLHKNYIKLENVIMKHYAPNHMLAPKKGSSQKGVQLKP